MATDLAEDGGALGVATARPARLLVLQREPLHVVGARAAAELLRGVHEPRRRRRLQLQRTRPVEDLGERRRARRGGRTAFPGPVITYPATTSAARARRLLRRRHERVRRARALHAGDRRCELLGCLAARARRRRRCGVGRRRRRRRVGGFEADRTRLAVVAERAVGVRVVVGAGACSEGRRRGVSGVRV